MAVLDYDMIKEIEVLADTQVYKLETKRSKMVTVPNVYDPDAPDAYEDEKRTIDKEIKILNKLINFSRDIFSRLEVETTLKSKTEGTRVEEDTPGIFVK